MPLERVYVLLALASANAIPARLVTGIHLEPEGMQAPLLHWVELLDAKGHWRGYDPNREFRGEVTPRYR